MEVTGDAITLVHHRKLRGRLVELAHDVQSVRDIAHCYHDEFALFGNKWVERDLHRNLVTIAMNSREFEARSHHSGPGRRDERLTE
ncbi:unannotated protein [freshwater metagenome]|uniref:Unannotated protein n=1 Tax=freshwater metagenome TaxID=449393 RepID=A0A6J7UYQ0_9ZZZZ